MNHLRYDSALDTLSMRLKQLYFVLILTIFSTGCSQVENIISPPTNQWYIPPTARDAATITPLPSETATQNPSSPTPSQTPGPTNTLRPSRTDYPTPTTTAITEPIIRIGPNNFPDYINPLTGHIAINPLLLDRRPIAVKIPNYPHYVYPQSGLSQADNVFEYHLEQGLTRFIAIFYGKDALKVGPIRSGRNFDAHIVQMYNSAFVFNLAYEEEGNDPLDVYCFLKRTLDNHLMVVEPGYATPWMWRDETIKSYNNLFGNTYNLSELITQRGVDNGNDTTTHPGERARP